MRTQEMIIQGINILQISIKVMIVKIREGIHAHNRIVLHHHRVLHQDVAEANMQKDIETIAKTKEKAISEKDHMAKIELLSTKKDKKKAIIIKVETIKNIGIVSR